MSGRPVATKLFVGTLKEIVSAKDRTLRHTISHYSVDRHGEVLRPLGCDTSEYRKNPLVLWCHDQSNVDAVIGKSLDVSPTETTVEAVTQFATTASALKVWDAYKTGLLSAWSVGFIPLKTSPEKVLPGRRGDYISAWSLLEYSAVPIGANTNALTQLAATLRTKGLLTLPPGASEQDLEHWGSFRSGHFGKSRQTSSRRPAPIERTPGTWTSRTWNRLEKCSRRA